MAACPCSPSLQSAKRNYYLYAVPDLLTKQDLPPLRRRLFGNEVRGCQCRVSIGHKLKQLHPYQLVVQRIEDIEAQAAAGSRLRYFFLRQFTVFYHVEQCALVLQIKVHASLGHLAARRTVNHHLRFPEQTEAAVEYQYNAYHQHRHVQNGIIGKQERQRKGADAQYDQPEGQQCFRRTSLLADVGVRRRQ